MEEVEHHSLIHWVGGDQLVLSNKLLMIKPNAADMAKSSERMKSDDVVQ